MPLYALGLNHRTASIEVRERVAFPLEAQRSAIDGLRQETDAQEIALISTCNRTEIYLRANTGEAIEAAARWLGSLPATQGLDLNSHLYMLSEAEVPRHVFRVASGLDSMILGEPQILGQVKLAVKIASEANALSGPLDRLFQETFKVA